MNRILKLLMLSDIFLITGFGLMDPILAIFIKENLIGGTIATAGIASTVFLITKSLVQLPFSIYVDKTKNKTKWLILGTLLVSTVPFFFIFAKSISFIFLAQIIHGVGSGLAFPTWLGLWSINLDKNRESFEWSVYSTSVSIGYAISAAIGAITAQFFGFVYTFTLVGILSIIGGLILFFLEKKSRQKKLF